MTEIGGRYRLEEPLGQGGVAVVWRARDTVLGRDVAIKRLHEDIDDPATLERFRTEAVAAAGIGHEGVVTVYDIGEEGDRTYLVMELVDGPSLADVLEEHGRLDPEVVAAIGREVGEALGAAHVRGIVHRDVKPANVLLACDGTVKVADFGIAKVLADVEANLTRTGKVVGTAAYLAPEQLTGGDVGPPTDVYALGLTLYEAVTGRAPFPGETTAEVAMARLTRDLPPPREVRGTVPERLEEVIARCLERDPAERYSDGAEVGRALGALVPTDARKRIARVVSGEAESTQTQPLVAAAHETASREPVRPPARGWTGRVVLGAVVVGLLGVLLVALWSLRDEPEPPGPVEVASATDFDPFGDGEHPDRVAHVLDGDADTTWTTQRYNSPDLGGLKPGVGLLFDLGEARALRAVEIDFSIPGADLAVYAFDEEPPADVDAWGDARAQITDAPADTVLEVDDGEGRYWLIWFTSLPADAGRHRTEISEVRLLGRGSLTRPPAPGR